jgi:hypothetical protein
MAVLPDGGKHAPSRMYCQGPAQRGKNDDEWPQATGVAVADPADAPPFRPRYHERNTRAMEG